MSIKVSVFLAFINFLGRDSTGPGWNQMPTLRPFTSDQKLQSKTGILIGPLWIWCFKGASFGQEWTQTCQELHLYSHVAGGCVFMTETDKGKLTKTETRNMKL